jgi:hypothetical protein
VSTYRPANHHHILTPWRCVVGSLAGWVAFLGYLLVLVVHGDPGPSEALSGCALMVLACATLASFGWVGVDWIDRRNARRLEQVHTLLEDIALRTPPVLIVHRHPSANSGRASVAAAPALTRSGMRTAGLDPTIVDAVRRLQRRIR